MRVVGAFVQPTTDALKPDCVASIRRLSVMRPAQVLVVDDDPDVRGLVCELLEGSGLETAGADTGQEALQKFFKLQPDLVVLDVLMPGMDGFETLGRIRDLSDVPVMMLTAMETELDKVRGLKSGADDYVTKPFGCDELLARTAALLRRPASGKQVSEVLSDSLVTIHVAQATATVNGQELPLTPLEFKLLATFVRHPNQVLSANQLLDLVWGISGNSRAQVKIYVGHLRRKLLAACAAEPIETVRGFGYRYRPNPAQA